jgi:LysM repeat protein
MDLGKQIGPLPLGAWIAVVAGGLGIALWTRKQDSSSAPTPVEDTSTDPGVGTGGSGMFIPLNPGSTGATGSPTYDTNEAWGQAAITWLIAQGYQAGLANSAITKGLAGGQDTSGNKMSVQEWSLWSLALAHLGPPPTPVNVSPPTGTPGPVDNGGGDNTTPTPPTPKPPSNKVPAHYVYTAVHGDTLSGIALKTNKQYNLHNSWQDIYNFNIKYRSPATAAIIKARGPNKFYAGSTWWIPK